MSVLVDGTSVITAGLDHWFPKDNTELALEDFVVHDWRLEARLKVKEFRLPPDWRSGEGDDRRNTRLSVPVLRFPCYAFCMYCKRLKQVPLSFQDVVRCQDAAHAGGPSKGPRMSQVPFVAICEDGHIDDFPFREWVHRSKATNCTGTLRLFSTGGGGLEGQLVRCGYDAKNKRDERQGCGASRSLMGITMAGRKTDTGEESTVLTQELEGRSDPYLCTGARPWLHEPSGPCDKPVRGALRAAGNVYFPRVESSIFLPQKVGAVSGAMRDLLRRPDVEPVLTLLHSMKRAIVTAMDLRPYLPTELFDSYSDEELLAAYRDRFGIGENGTEDDDHESDDLDIWRYPEFKMIRETPQDDELRASDPGVHPALAGHIERVRSVTVLRETRALRGFTRGRDGELKVPVGKALLRRRPLIPERDWLPAYVVKGEGIYFELDAQRLGVWEARGDVQGRANKMANRYGQVITDRGGRPRDISARMVMLHTLAHLLINELVFTCGYSSASLRERLYVSRDGGRGMAGLLIYTAAGDSEGTMGGLVRMARTDHLRPVFASALSNAHWCSTDPVCMDAGKRGQGPDSCNLAACHGCALLPETSCEEFNRFLDRGLVVGTFDTPDLGYFSSFV
ncbi:DrmB family protein [Nocardia gamkensis]|uniref:DrmB family protein n=1 Tax=Nocardia gamkensis TaxID=352869 RepID=UPI0037B179E0